MNLSVEKDLTHRDEGTILLVDDNPKNLQLLLKLLAKEKYKTSVAMNGIEALEILKSLRPDLIILDIMMPEMDGYETCEHIKSDDSLKHIPVIFLSAKDELIDKIRAFHIGGADYIIKPFRTAEILARVHTHLQLKFAQDTIREYNNELEKLVERRTKELIAIEKHAAFSLFINGIIHNLRNPLTGIMGSAQLAVLELDAFEKALLNSGLKNNTDLRERIGRLRKPVESFNKAGNRLNELIDSLLAKSRSDQNSDISVHNLNDLVRYELEFLQSDLRFKREVKNVVDLDPKPIKIKVAPIQISQIIQNLVQNALDALNGRPGAQIRIHTYISDNHAILSLSDNGPGIAKENLDKIFDPFFTTKNGDQKDTGKIGTGLGLYTCRDIANTLGGMIEVDSESDKGTTFLIKIPLAQ